MKKLLLTLGAVASVAAPVAAVVACGSTPDVKPAQKQTLSSELIAGIKTLNEDLKTEVAKTVAAAIAENPENGKYTETAGMKLVAANAADWKIEIKVVTEGFGKPDADEYYTPTEVAADEKAGYKVEFTKPMLSYKDASAGLPVAVELSTEGINKFFKDYAFGSLSLGNTGTETAFTAEKALVETFITKFASELA